jgi:hypothetical protein
VIVTEELGPEVFPFCRYVIQVFKEAGMKGSRFGAAVCATALLAVSLGAQQTSRATQPLTKAQLQAKVHALEEENAVLTRNYDLLLASCRSHVQQDAQPTGASESAARNTTSTGAAGSARRVPRNVDDDLFWVEDLHYGVTETTSISMRFGWRVMVHNGLARNEVFDVIVQFLNEDDLVIGSSHIGVQTIRAFDEQAVTGDTVIGLPAALNVASAKAVVNRHR